MALSRRNLVHFIALAEEGRISLAAARVHLSPSAFSRSIQAVEEGLGLQLFTRSMNGATLTAAGKAVLHHARALDFENKRFELNLDLLRRGDSDRVCIGAAPIPACLLMPELLRRLHEQTPHLMIQAETGSIAGLLERLDRSEIDLCLLDIRNVQGNDERYASKKLAVIRCVVCCRAEHPLVASGRVTARDLVDHRLAFARVDSIVEREVRACFGLDAAEPIPMTVACDDVNVLAGLLATTNLIGVLPQGVYEQHASALRMLEPDDPSSLYAYVHAVWPKNRMLPPSALKALDVARSVAQA